MGSKMQDQHEIVTASIWYLYSTQQSLKKLFHVEVQSQIDVGLTLVIFMCVGYLEQLRLNNVPNIEVPKSAIRLVHY